MSERAKLPLSCEEEHCYRAGPILGATRNGALRLCGEHYLQKVDDGEVEGTIKRDHSVCMQCPATLCTDFGNGYMSTRDYDADTVDYQKGSIYECPILQQSVYNPQEGMYVDEEGKRYYEMKSVNDIEDAK